MTKSPIIFGNEKVALELAYQIAIVISFRFSVLIGGVVEYDDESASLHILLSRNISRKELLNFNFSP
jgi:hypothetical protein